MMTIRGKLCASAAAIGIAVLAAAPFSDCRPAAELAPGRHGRPERSRRHRQRRGRTGSGRLGDRGDERPADEVRQDRRHRRPGALPDSGSAESEYASGCAATGWSTRAKMQATPGSMLNLTAGARGERRRRRRRYYPAMYWFVARQGAGGERISAREDEEPGQWLNTIKTGACHSCHGARHAGHADDLAGARRSSSPRTRPGRSACMRAARRRSWPATSRRLDTPAGDRDVRRLDRPHRRGRAAVRQAGAAARHRAQRGGHAVGLGHAHVLPARRGLDRPPQSARQRQRRDLRHRRRTARTSCRCSIR